MGRPGWPRRLPQLLAQLRGRILSRENLVALALCLILIALVIATASNAPQWIYQGF